MSPNPGGGPAGIAPDELAAHLVAAWAPLRFLVWGNGAAEPVLRALADRGVVAANAGADRGFVSERTSPADTVAVLWHGGITPPATVVDEACAAADVIVVAPALVTQGAHVAAWVEAFTARGFAAEVAGPAHRLDAFRRTPASLAARAVPWTADLARREGARRSEERALLAARTRAALAWHERRDLSTEVEALAARLASLETALDAEAAHVAALAPQAEAAEATRRATLASPEWRIARALQDARGGLAPPGSRRERALSVAGIGVAATRGGGLGAGWTALRSELGSAHEAAYDLSPVAMRPDPPDRSEVVDLVVCVHDALDDVRRCLASVVAHSGAALHVILVDDGSGPETAAFLRDWATEHGAQLLRNDEATGYTWAANQGLAAGSAPFACLLNSDTIVTPRWLDRLAACLMDDERVGIAGPLSNTASWQSIPALEADGDWAANELPADLTPTDMAATLAATAARMRPEVPLLNGFCLLLRRRMLDEVGAFDEAAFGAGYGEEDDLAFRARAAGWRLVIADDAYVYHAQSRSYSTERRRALSERAGAVLAGRHGARVAAAVEDMHHGRVMVGLRGRARTLPDRHRWTVYGRHHAGRRVLFVLPMASAGGGANVVFDEARAMRRMGVDVAIYNTVQNREAFQAAYPFLEMPVTYGGAHRLADDAKGFDAVVATANYTVPWLEKVDGPVRGYYIQGFEPWMYPPGGPEFEAAWRSYTLLDETVLVTKTRWNQAELARWVGATATANGISVDLATFRPRPRRWPRRPGTVRVAAMIRPESPFRAPVLTMEVLGQVQRAHGAAAEVWLFGVGCDEPAFRRLPHDFAWSCAGRLPPRRVARLLNECDVFVDFSTHQAMGLTALEAMACGAAIVVPRAGGSVEFARDGENAIVVDSADPGACGAALSRLVADGMLRDALARQALWDVADHFPERCAARMLDALFGAPSGPTPDEGGHA